MAVKTSEQLIDFVRQMKTAIQQAQLQTPDITVTKMQLQLKTTLSGGPGIDWKVMALEISGSYTQSEIQTIDISLTPRPPAIELTSPVSSHLIDAIASISAAARAAAVAEPKFDLQEGTITLNVGVDKEGKAMIIVGGSVASSNYHTLTLSVKSK